MRDSGTALYLLCYMSFKTLFTFRKTYVIYPDWTKANYIKCTNRVIMHLGQVDKIVEYILKPTANWSPYIFTLIQKVKRRVYKIHVFLS